MVGAMDPHFEMREPPAPWGSRQPRFERLERDDGGRYFLVYREPSGEETRVELGPTPRFERPS
jgi:hypothetical protein